MKNRVFPRQVWMIGGMVLLVHVAMVFAQDPPPTTTSPEAAVTASSRQIKPVQLSDGVSDILTLVHGHVGDDIIVSFIENSRKSYNLTANEIIYLRAEKVSDRVLAAMMNQLKKATQSPTVIESQAATPVAPPPPTADTSSATVSTDVQPATAYVQAPSVSAPNAPVYVSPGYPAYGYPYYGYPYYGYVPPVSLSFGFGYGYYGHGYYGHGYYGHGGGYHGGGYHGGGGSHGGGGGHH